MGREVYKIKHKKYKIGFREVNVGGPEPPLHKDEKLLDKTLSVCPVCYRLIPAIIFEREGKVWIRKVCPEHGEVEDVYYGDYEMYKRVMKYKAKPAKLKVTYTSYDKPCPFSCGLCPLHKNYTALVNLVATNRCDLSCWYCFFYAEKAGFVYEPTLEQIKFMLASARRQYPHGATALQITGGEPLLREDLVDIIKIARDLGYSHIQLNTDGIRFSFENGAELARRLRRLDDGRLGVNTVYLSFDAVSKINFKNHWEIPYIFYNFRKAGMTSVVLVPTVIRGWNTHELGDIIYFAAENIDIVRGVNFQPVSITGSMPREKRLEARITIPDVVKLIEEQTNGEIPRDCWYPVPTGDIIASYIQALTGRPFEVFKTHPVCGVATYVYVKRKASKVVGFEPITDFINVDEFLEFLKEETEHIENARVKPLRKLISIGKLIRKLKKCIMRNPEGVDLWKILRAVFLKHNYKALSVFHYNFLFLGMMHFMDTYNYDVKRVMRCCIHYVVPDGRVIPFCAFNVLPELYRDYIQKKYSIPLEEWIKIKGKHTVGEAIKYRRNAKKLESGEIYKKTYASFMKKWRK